MRSNKKLKKEIESTNTLSQIVEAYQEIAAIRMRRVKKSVLQNREFLSGLNDIYAQVAYSYKSTNKKHAKKKLEGTLRKVNKDSVAILLSANTGLYGDIVKQTFNYFVKDTAEKKADLVIVGRLGKKMYDNLGDKRPYTFYEFSDSASDPENTKKIIQSVVEYENIYVYHGLFKSILSQVPQRTAVTGSVMSEISETSASLDPTTNKPMQYLFEPSIDEIIYFFEKEILLSIFEQSVYESGLSKFASRMISLDYAMANIKSSMKVTAFKLQKSKHALADASQMSTFAGYSLWKSM